MKEIYFDLNEAATYLRVTPRVLRGFCKRRLVAFCRLDRTHWKFTEKDLDAFIASRTVRARSVYK